MDIAKEVSKSLSERIVIATVRLSDAGHECAMWSYFKSLGRWRPLGFRTPF